MEIRIVASVIAKPDQVTVVAEILTRVVAPSRAETGNLQYDLHMALDAPDKFVFFERWVDREALTRHEATPHFQQLVAELAGKTVGMDVTLLRALA